MHVNVHVHYGMTMIAASGRRWRGVRGAWVAASIGPVNRPRRHFVNSEAVDADEVCRKLCTNGG